MRRKIASILPKTTHIKDTVLPSIIGLKVLFVLFFLAVGCKDPFTPEVDAKNKDLLVVEGHLIIGGVTIFMLSRTGDLQDPRFRNPEPNAKVIIEGNDGSIVLGSSNENGECVLFTQNLDIAKSYRVKIARANGKTYETDYLENKATPEIDSLNFGIDGDGFEIYANTHDATNKTRYYSWDFSESWEIRSGLPSWWEYKNGKIVERITSVDRCWQYNSSSSILLGSTERLSEDRLSSFPLTRVQGTSIKLSHLYSILVRQYGLTREAYQYMETMKKNTEEIGTIFDPQPSELKGNIKCISDPEEQVIGWISSGTISEKRIFISSNDKPSQWAYRESCEPQMMIHTDTLRLYLGKDFLIHDRIVFEPPSPAPPPPPWKFGDTAYTIAPKECIDCTLRGSNVKPTYWPN